MKRSKQMSPDKEKELYEKYPKIFVQKDLDMTQTAMCWGLDCSDGWYNIIDTLCEKIQSHIDWENEIITYKKERGELPKEKPLYPQVQATQVKEKYGGLRFYVNYYDDYIRGLIDMAENMSYCVCETCGNPGKPNESGWISTLCDPCREKKEARWNKLNEEAKNKLTVNMKDVTVAP